MSHSADRWRAPSGQNQHSTSRRSLAVLPRPSDCSTVRDVKGEEATATVSPGLGPRSFCADHGVGGIKIAASGRPRVYPVIGPPGGAVRRCRSCHRFPRQIPSSEGAGTRCRFVYYLETHRRTHWLIRCCPANTTRATWEDQTACRHMEVLLITTLSEPDRPEILGGVCAVEIRVCGDLICVRVVRQSGRTGGLNRQ